jgi:MFS family permease
MTATQTSRISLLANTEFVILVCSRLLSALAGMAFATVIGLQIYRLTKDPLALGWMGLIEAIPALALSLLGGHFADRHDRRKLTLVTALIQVAGLAALCYIALNPERWGIGAIYVIIFIFGMAAGFYRPAFSAFEAQIIPDNNVARATSILGGVWQAGAIAGAPLAGFLIDSHGIPFTYGLIVVCMALSLVCVALIKPKPMPKVEEGETVWQSLREGVRYVFRSQPLAGSMALDLFAVLFGGAMALLPIFADDILKVGAQGLGWLRTAPSLGVLLVMLIATRKPPTRNAGRNLLLVVAAFGLSFIVFALSQNFWLSLAALFFSGVTDGISMIIRMVILRVMSPEHMRGRINAVSWMFIGASNEIGAFESGVAARLLGTAPSVFWSATVTLLVVAVVAITMPDLRNLKLEE